jgi:hypothetical protein
MSLVCSAAMRLISGIGKGLLLRPLCLKDTNMLYNSALRRVSLLVEPCIAIFFCSVRIFRFCRSQQNSQWTLSSLLTEEGIVGCASAVTGPQLQCVTLPQHRPNTGPLRAHATLCIRHMLSLSAFCPSYCLTVKAGVAYSTMFKYIVNTICKIKSRLPSEFISALRGGCKNPYLHALNFIKSNCMFPINHKRHS